jgi:hypothetical protein
MRRRSVVRRSGLLHTAAVGADEFGADAADPNELGFESLSRSMEANGGIAGGDSGPGCEGFKALACEVDAAENLAVGGLDGGKDLLDTTADDLLGLSVRWDFCCEVLCPLLESAVFGGTVAIVIDNGVAQDAIEPGDGRFFTAQDRGVFDGADIGGLDDVFRDGRGVDSALYEMEEVISLLNQVSNGFYLHGAFPHREGGDGGRFLPPPL